MQIVAAIAVPVDEQLVPGAFFVQALIGGGRSMFHQGPAGDVAYFTQAQAERLARRVDAAKAINPRFWDEGLVSEAELEDRWAVDAMERW